MKKILKKIIAINYPLGLFFVLVAAFVSAILIAYNNQNSAELKLDFYTCVLMSLLCVAALVASVVLAKISPKASVVVNSVCNGIAFYMLLAIVFFPVQRGVLDGAAASISQWDKIIHLATFLFCIVFGITSIYKEKLSAFFSKIVTILGCFCLVAGVYMSKDVISKDNRPYEDWQEATRLSLENNIIVICLDMVQQDFARRYFENSSQARTEFDGFTFFTNTASASPYTALSLSTIVRGGMFAGKTTDAPPKDNLINDMLKHGYDVNVPTLVAARAKKTKCKTIPSSALKGIWHNVLALLLLGSDRYLPIVLDLGTHKEFGWISKTDQREAYKTFIDFLHVDPKAKKRMVWLHTLQTHYPVRFTKDGAFSFDLSPDDVYGEIADAFTMTEGLLRKLKELGVYDNTLILIISDHGFKPLKEMKSLTPEQLYLLRPLTEKLKDNLVAGQYQPVIMSKPLHAKGTLNYSNNAVTLMDIRATLNEFVVPGAAPTPGSVNILDYDNVNINRSVPIFVISGSERAADITQSTKQWRIENLQMPLSGDYMNDVTQP